MAITRRTMLCAAAGVLAPRRSATAARRPNVLFIPVDDLNRSLHCFGNPQVKTPNIDRLAESGVRFTNTYANYASCLPSRISFLSGWYPERTGVMTFTPRPRDRRLRDAVYLPQHFRGHGYITARLDKVFHIGGDEPSCWDITEEPLKDDQGRFRVVSTPKEIEAQKLQPRVLAQGDFPRCGGEKGTYAVLDVNDSELIDGINTRRASALMEQFAQQDKPFFLAVGLRRPHLPRILPKRYFDMYPPEHVELSPQPPNYDAETWISVEDRRRIIAHYYAATSFMDARVGELMATLDRLKLKDNTIVVLFGDQGYALGERDNHYGKGTLGELSFAVPLIIAAPGRGANGKGCSKIVELIDMYPTLAELCGLPQPASGLQGRSLKPLLDSFNAAWEERAISAWGLKDYQRPGLSARTPRYRYSESEGGKPLELFDHDSDPYEWRNMVDDPQHAVPRRRLAEILHANRS